MAEPNHNRPWICHFHLCKVVEYIEFFVIYAFTCPLFSFLVCAQEEMNKRGLNLHQVRYVLERECASTGEKPEFGFSKMQILCGYDILILEQHVSLNLFYTENCTSNIWVQNV